MSILRIDKFYGGLADSLYSGVAGSFANGSFGIDIHSTPGSMQSQYKLSKDSGTTVVGLILWSFKSSNGDSYFFDDVGNIYKRAASNGAWTLLRTESGGPRICGAAEYNGKYYWAISNKLYSMAITGDWSSGITTEVTWANAEIDSNWHMMKIGPTGFLYIGAGQYLTRIDTAGSVITQALDLPPKWTIKPLEIYADYLLIGANFNGENTCAIFKYDGYGDTFLTPTYLPVPSIDFIFTIGNMVIVGSGTNGKIYQYLLNDFSDLKRIPGTYTSSVTGAFYPSATGYFNDTFVFGSSKNGGNPNNQGVYSWGSANKNYPKVLNLDFQISTGNQSGATIGSILCAGGDMYVAWKDTTGGTTYGIDKVDFTTRLNTATFNTVILGGAKPTKTFKRYTINFEPLPASCAVTLKYKTNRQSSWTAFTDAQAGTTTTVGITSVSFDQVLRAEIIELQVIFTTSGTSTPLINNIEVEYESDRSFG